MGRARRDSFPCYLLWSYQRVFFGEITVEKNKTLPDASVREKWILATMAVVTLWMGINSPFITRRTAGATQTVMDQVEPERAYEAVAPAKEKPKAGVTSVNAKTREKNASSNAAATISVERLGIH